MMDIYLVNSVLSQILNITANTLATPVFDQMASWRDIITLRLMDFLHRNSHYVIKKTT